jgi:unsaturated rhamnogalacturonyl hydrolase
MKKILAIVLLLAVHTANAQLDYSKQMAATAMQAWKDSATFPKNWNYETGVILNGIEGLWYLTGDKKYFDYLQQCIDHYIADDGSIKTYNIDDYNIDNILCGKTLLTLFLVTGKDKYYKAARLLRKQVQQQPRTNEGGFWHKKRYPNQMWLDGLYMGEPFYAEWASVFQEDSAFNDIASQFIFMERHARDPATGLLYHGWDESRQEKWADKQTGRSPNFWARAMGWYGMALVDALDYFPATNPKKDTLVAILNRLVKAVTNVQDTSSGLWWNVINRPGEKGNYTEASAACMFVYTIAKAIRNGYLPASYSAAAEKAYNGIITTFVAKQADGKINLNGTVSVSGLGGNPYRDGSYAYYVSEKQVTNDPKGIGAFLLASNEMERLHKQATGKGKTVLLDSYFNNESKVLIEGIKKSWHYKWNELDNGGFSMLGYTFNTYGAAITTCFTAPSPDVLSKANIYIIVDPDVPKENPAPNYISDDDVQVISGWVNNGGVLVLLANDTGNAEFEHFNKLASRFGIQFNMDSKNRVQGSQFEMGAITVAEDNKILKTARTLYIKEYASLSVQSPAEVVLRNNNDIVMAVAKQGKGTVFAVGDPWLYNEYVDGRKLPGTYENYKAIDDLVQWLLKQVTDK